jgi:hypothetical protein
MEAEIHHPDSVADFFRFQGEPVRAGHYHISASKSEHFPAGESLETNKKI